MPNDGTLLTSVPAAGPSPAPVDMPAAPPSVSPASLRFALPDDLKGHESFRKLLGEDGMIDSHAMAKSYVNAQSLIGRDKVPVPKTDEDWDAWFAAAGRPKDSNGYQFNRPEKMPDGFYSEDDEKTFRQWAHAQGLNQKQAAAFYDSYLKVQIERMSAWNDQKGRAVKDAESALRREWGDAYDGHVRVAHSAFRQFAADDDGVVAMINESGLGNNPAFIKLFARIGKDMMGESKLEGAPAMIPATPGDMDKARAEFRSKHKDVLLDPKHPEYKIRYAEYQEMLDGRYGQTPHVGS